MSSRPKKAKEEKRAETTQTAKAEPVKPSGKAPDAVITGRHGTGFVTRLGRGFSMGELAGAGLSRNLASKWGVRLDYRRRSVVESNVSSLRSWNSHPKAVNRKEGVAKEVEEEIEKVGREVKKEAVKVKKEAEKVEREVKEEAVKAEKAVKRKSKPKKKAKS
ncbi:MAG TPA: ribosomal protein L13e [Nitrososphaerales archaeon]|nr:ribosomal protein L13e [Nitrososphaerales archaeon]